MIYYLDLFLIGFSVVFCGDIFLVVSFVCGIGGVFLFFFFGIVYLFNIKKEKLK